MNFPYISHLNDLRPFIENNPQFRIQAQPNGFIVVCYMLQDEDTFRGEHEEYAKECRGITFDMNGKIVSRTLHKFQNIGENEFTQPDQIPWDRIVRVMDKRDGSMITFVNINGQIVGKTKKTFTSNEAIAATEFLYKDPMKVDWVRAMLACGITPTFEWTSPRFPIVLTYKEDALTLLQLRDNTSGEYVMLAFDPKFNPDFAKGCPFPIVENVINDFKQSPNAVLDYADFHKLQLEKEGVEGWIVQADTGEMWKVKTKWYCDLHHSVTFTRWRDVARTVLEDKSDDLKSAFMMTGRSIEPILEVERQIGETIDLVRDRVHLHTEQGKMYYPTAKEMALAYKDYAEFGLIMKVYRGQEIDWFEWFRKNHIDSFSLEVIPTAVQNEDVHADAA